MWNDKYNTNRKLIHPDPKHSTNADYIYHMWNTTTGGVFPDKHVKSMVK